MAILATFVIGTLSFVTTTSSWSLDFDFVLVIMALYVIWSLKTFKDSFKKSLADLLVTIQEQQNEGNKEHADLFARLQILTDDFYKLQKEHDASKCRFTPTELPQTKEAVS